jgi:hypothetical protein
MGAAYVKDAIERLVKPEIGSIALSDIRRCHLAPMINKIADENGCMPQGMTMLLCR